MYAVHDTRDVDNNEHHAAAQITECEYSDMMTSDKYSSWIYMRRRGVVSFAFKGGSPFYTQLVNTKGWICRWNNDYDS